MTAPIWRPPRLRTTEEREDRHATWLELFFDLVFVVAVAQPASLLSHDVTWSGLGTAQSGMVRFPLTRAAPVVLVVGVGFLATLVGAIWVVAALAAVTVAQAAADVRVVPLDSG